MLVKLILHATGYRVLAKMLKKFYYLTFDFNYKLLLILKLENQIQLNSKNVMPLVSRQRASAL
jgi:hypothetical protein